MTRQEILVAIRNALIVMRDEADELRDRAKQIRLRGRELQDVYTEFNTPNKWERQ